MSRWERTYDRDLTYSQWHRYACNDAAAYVDIDSCEYCRGCWQPLCLVEIARDVGQTSKSTYVTSNLAERANIAAFCLLYTVDESTDDPARKIVGFRLRVIQPSECRNYDWAVLRPDEWVDLVHDLHKNCHRCRLRTVMARFSDKKEAA